MEFSKEGFKTEEFYDESINFNQVVEKYLKHLKWFIISVTLILVVAFFKLRYTYPSYNITSKILIKEKEKGNSINDLAAFENLGLFGNSNSSLENEIQILKSRTLMENVVRELKLNITYFIDDSPLKQEQYLNFPLTLLSGNTEGKLLEVISTDFEIEILSKKRFNFIQFNGERINNRSFGQAFKANIGNVDRTILESIIIEYNDDYEFDLVGAKIIVRVRSIESMVNQYMSILEIEPVNERMSNVLILSINNSKKEKGIALLNNLVEQFNADGINDNNMVSQATTDFLDLRIGLLSTELVAIESTAEQFKRKNRMVDVGSGSNLFLESSTMNENDIVEANTQAQLTSYMLDELERSVFGDLLPGNVGLADPSIVNMITEYNSLILQRNRVLKSSSTRNPIIVNIDSQLNVLKKNLVESLNNSNSTLKIKINSLNNQNQKINSRIAAVPKNEREFKDIVRQQETKNALYLFLLQKREESILSNAVSVEKAKIIDGAYSNGKPVSPKKMMFFLGAIIVGILIPFSIIYIKDMMDTKIHSEADVKRLGIPFIGDVPFVKAKHRTFVKDGDDSNIAEAFRFIRTNIHFMLDRIDQCKTIFITSTQSHEGKTSTAINLASSLSISGKKVLLVAMDLRAPKIDFYLKLESRLGVTNFIKDDDLMISDIIDMNTNIRGLDLIQSGDIPPNPVELLMSKRVDEIFEYGRNNYDYVIVDSAPVGMVTDTIQISQHSDLTIYVIKANFLDKRMLHIPERLHKEGKLPNMTLLINGTDTSTSSYGYGYGYGQKEILPWYKRSLFS